MAVPGGDAVRRLQAFIVEHQLEITTAPPEPGLGGHEGVVLVVSAPQNPALRITVFDEYGDARPDNPALCLALLNMQFRELGNAGGEMGRWAIAEGLSFDRCSIMVHLSPRSACAGPALSCQSRSLTTSGVGP